MSVLSLLAILGGLVLLVLGAEALVRGAASWGARWGLSSLVVGLTIVAFATSAPELAIGVQSALQGSPGLVVGTVVGSNIVNIFLVLGLTALVGAVAVRRQLLKLDIPIMIGLSVLVLILAIDGGFGTIDGLIMLIILLLYVAVVLWYSRRAPQEWPSDSEVAGDTAAVPSTETAQPTAQRRPVRLAIHRLLVAARETKLRSVITDTVLVLVGVGMLVVGADLLVNASTALARDLGVSDLVIGVTVIAIGTALPEIATSVIAALRGERDMAVGNLVGSNIFNIGAVLGISAIVAPVAVSVERTAFIVDIPVMVAAALVLLMVALIWRGVGRVSGAFLLSLYGAYLVYVVLAAAS